MKVNNLIVDDLNHHHITTYLTRKGALKFALESLLWILQDWEDKEMLDVLARTQKAIESGTTAELEELYERFILYGFEHNLYYIDIREGELKP